MVICKFLKLLSYMYTHSPKTKIVCSWSGILLLVLLSVLHETIKGLIKNKGPACLYKQASKILIKKDSSFVNMYLKYYCNVFIEN